MLQFHIDTKTIEEGLNLALKWSTRAPRRIVYDTTQRIAYKAQINTPSVDVATIDAELDVTYKPGLTPKGRVSKAKKRRVAVGGTGGSTQNKAHALAIWIQFARMNIAGRNRGRGNGTTSNYNISTNNRWALDKEMLRGRGVAGRASLLESLADRMIKSRHSSTKFLVSGWVAVRNRIKMLRRAGDPADSADMLLNARTSNLGYVETGGDDTSAFMYIANRVGMEDGKRGSNATNYNQALLTHGLPALQKAVDEQGREMVNRYTPREIAALQAQWSALR